MQEIMWKEMNKPPFTDVFTLLLKRSKIALSGRWGYDSESYTVKPLQRGRRNLQRNALFGRLFGSVRSVGYFFATVGVAFYKTCACYPRLAGGAMADFSKCRVHKTQISHIVRSQLSIAKTNHCGITEAVLI
jgi:hypothetical protein